MSKEKLVRDKMPALCAVTPGMTPMRFRVAGHHERLNLILAKLKEEVQELSVSITDEFGRKEKMIEEFGDVAQVLRDLINMTTTSGEEIEAARKKKFELKGGFSMFYIWDGNR